LNRSIRVALDVPLRDLAPLSGELLREPPHTRLESRDLVAREHALVARRRDLEHGACTERPHRAAAWRRARSNIEGRTPLAK
jgi:hypothetical protein